MRKSLFVVAGLAALLCTGCMEFLTQNKTAPSTTVGATVEGMSGSWASVSSTTPVTGMCTNFHWSITEFTGTTGSGTFSATCGGNLQVSGTARGTLSGTTVNWTASAVGTAPGNVSCPISLTGTATFDGTQFRVPYTGTTCNGPVSGTEILRKS